VQTNIINVALNYKYILYIKIVYTNYFINNLNIFANKTLVFNSSILFTHPSINKKPYYNNSLSLSKNINLTSISSRFNLPSDLVPLMGPRRPIPIVKTQYLLKKTHFWVNKKPPRET